MFRKMIINIMLVSSAICLMFSCRNESQDESKLYVLPLHNMLYDAVGQSVGQAHRNLDSLIVDYSDILDAALIINGVDTLSADALYCLATSPAFKVFYSDVERLAPSNDELNKNLNYILKKTAEQNINLPIKHFATLVWGKPQSILFCDSIMFIGLNHYLGADYPGYDSFDSYIRQFKTPKALPYDMAEALVATEYPFELSDSSAVINRLIYEGALITSKMLFVKDAKLSEALGYTDEQLKLVDMHKDEIWQIMLSKRLIFDKDMFVADRLVKPAPYSTMISQECPGRIGRYIGYKIVEQYLKHHDDIKLADVLSPDFYNSANPLDNIY